LNEGEKGAKAKEIETKQKSLQRNYEDAQAEFQAAEQEVVNRSARKCSPCWKNMPKAMASLWARRIQPQGPVLIATRGPSSRKNLWMLTTLRT